MRWWWCTSLSSSLPYRGCVCLDPSRSGRTPPLTHPKAKPSLRHPHPHTESLDCSEAAAISRWGRARAPPSVYPLLRPGQADGTRLARYSMHRTE